MDKAHVALVTLMPTLLLSTLVLSAALAVKRILAYTICLVRHWSFNTTLEVHVGNYKYWYYYRYCLGLSAVTVYSLWDTEGVHFMAQRKRIGLLLLLQMALFWITFWNMRGLTLWRRGCVLVVALSSLGSCSWHTRNGAKLFFSDAYALDILAFSWWSGVAVYVRLNS